jgi:hypothetical protein
MPLDQDGLFCLVHNYMIHSGYVNSLAAFESEASFDKLNKQKIQEQAEEL